MTNSALPAEVLAHLRAGRKRDAVELLRASRGGSLADAHAAITLAIAADPELARRYAGDAARQRRGALQVLLVGVALIGLAGWIVFGQG